MSAQQLNFGGPSDALDGAPSGIRIAPDLIDEDSERFLLQAIDGHDWSAALSRRVQHYGWRYDYKSRSVRADDYLGPLPEFLTALAERVCQECGFVADQAIVNEYLPGQGIAPHVDCEPCFGPIIAMVALASDVQMDFIELGSGTDWSVAFARRSLIELAGPARSSWSHGIAKRRCDSRFDITRQRRVSVTFRTVNTELASADRPRTTRR
jgi:alkylated DNA repair dioxygenase AlkB